MNREKLANAWPFLAFLSPMLIAGALMLFVPSQAESFAQTANPGLYIRTWGEFLLQLPCNPIPWIVFVSLLVYSRWKNIVTGMLLLLVFNAFSTVGLYTLVSIVR